MSEQMPMGPETAPRYRYDQLSPDTIAQTVQDRMSQADELVARLLEAAAAPSFASVIGALDQTSNTLGWEGACGREEQLLRDAHPDEAIRDAARAGCLKLDAYFANLYCRTDVYAIVKTFSQTAEAQALDPESEEGRLLADTLLRFKRMGQEGSEADREAIKTELAKIGENSAQFTKNIFEDPTKATFAPAELDGLPATALADFPTAGSAEDQTLSYVLPLTQSNLDMVLQQARSRAARQRMWCAFNSVAKDTNEPLLLETVALRQDVARRAGYASWAGYRYEDTMIGTEEAANSFLNSLKGPLLAKAQREIAAMQPLLAADGYGDEIQAWDVPYYAERIREQMGVSDEQISKYLTLENAVNGLMALTGEMYGLQYERLENVGGWHEDVQAFAVKDANGEPVSTIFLDLYYRPGKNKSAVTYTLQIADLQPSGSYSQPEMALVAGFNKPADGAPCLLRPKELKTLFHEWGHVMHGSVTRTKTIRFAKVQPDTVEAPSQMMEHGALSAQVLQRFARHYQTGEVLPQELIDKYAAAQKVTIGLDTIRDFQLALFDLRLHDSTQPKNLQAIYEEATALSGTPLVPDTSWYTRFAHPFVGYDSIYLGYPLSRVDGDDMNAALGPDGLLNTAGTRKFRQDVLEPGGSITAPNRMRAFLGRDPNKIAFLAYRDIQLSAKSATR